MFRTAFTIVAVLAVLHILALLGAGGYLAATGRLKADNLRAAADGLLHGSGDADDEGAEADVPVEEASRSEEAIAKEQDREEMERRTAQRKTSELYQKQVAVGLLMQQTLEQMHKLEADRRFFEEQTRERVRKEQEEGFKKLVQMLGTARPDAAKDLLFQGFTSDEAARILLQLNARNGVKIITAAMGDPTLRGKALQAFKLIQETAPEGSDWSAVARPTEDPE